MKGIETRTGHSRTRRTILVGVAAGFTLLAWGGAATTASAGSPLDELLDELISALPTPAPSSPETPEQIGAPDVPELPVPLPSTTATSLPSEILDPPTLPGSPGGDPVPGTLPSSGPVPDRPAGSPGDAPADSPSATAGGTVPGGTVTGGDRTAGPGGGPAPSRGATGVATERDGGRAASGPVDALKEAARRAVSLAKPFAAPLLLAGLALAMLPMVARPSRLGKLEDEDLTVYRL